MNEWLGLAIGVALTFGTGIFVAAEFTLVNLDRNELEARRDRGEKHLGPVISALRHTSTQLSSAQLGITLTTLLTGFTMEPAITSLLSGFFVQIGIPEDLVRVAGAIVAMVFATLLSMLLGELIPKNLALAEPVATAKLVVPVQNVFTSVLRWPIAALNNSANAIIRSFGIDPKEELSGARTAEELSSLVRRSAIAGVLEDDRAVLLSRTLRFSEHSADEVMTPRPRVDSVGVERPVQEVIDLAATTGHSRFPVVDGDIDEVVGVVHVKSAVAVPIERRESVPVGAIKQDALMVPETMGLDALLGELRGGGFQMAVVLDEYGGTAGVATLEDLVEEIVGELVDEHDRTQAELPPAHGSLEFDGLLRPDEVRDRFNVVIDEDGPYETVGGFLMARLGRIPDTGDRVDIGTGTLEVVRMDGRRVERVRFHPGEGYERREQLLARLDESRRQDARGGEREGGRRG